MRELTAQEEDAIDKLRMAWNALCALPEEHKDDHSEMRFHMHALQRVVFTRPAREAYNTAP